MKTRDQIEAQKQQNLDKIEELKIENVELTIEGYLSIVRSKIVKDSGVWNINKYGT